MSKEYLCGVGNIRPSWLQIFATSKCFALVFAVLGIFQASFRSYLVGTLSTVEKRFSMSSKQTSIIMIGDDISPVIGAILIMLFMKDNSKPRWIGITMICSGFASVAAMLPFIFYGPATHLTTSNPNSTISSSGFAASKNSATMEYCNNSSRIYDPRCHLSEDDGSLTTIPLWCLFLGNFLNGVGGAGYYVLGTAFLDDNVKKKHTALYFGTLYFVRMLGPTLGFTLSSNALKIQENLAPSGAGGLTPTDPKWIGAWWLGYIVIGLGTTIMAVIVLLFPKKIRSKAEANNVEFVKTESVAADFRTALQVIVRLLRIPIYTAQLIGFVVSYIGLAGYFITFPKYLEHQFQKTASQASTITGPVYITSNALGILLGSVWVHFFKPSPRIVAVHAFLANLFAGVAFLVLSVLECDYPTNQILNDCGCDCSTTYYSPVCNTEKNTQYFSPCFAGCSLSVNDSTNLLSGCSCGSMATELMAGRCELDCDKNFLIHAAIIFAIQLSLATTYVGGNLIGLRCILPEDKSVSLAFKSTCLNLFAFIPYPIIYSFLMDNACEIWEDKCGATGSCWVYDLTKMRKSLHIVTGTLLLICTCFRLIVVYYSGTIKNFYEDPDDKKDPLSDRKTSTNEEVQELMVHHED